MPKSASNFVIVTFSLTKLLDTRFEGVACGVGTAKIIGRVHKVDMTLGDLEIPCSFTVIEGRGNDLLVGLDMLRRFEACIDLKKNALVIGSHQIPFLPEHEVPAQPDILDSSSSGLQLATGDDLVTEEKIRALTALGINRETAIQNLKKADGDVEVAASISMIF